MTQNAKYKLPIRILLLALALASVALLIITYNNQKILRDNEMATAIEDLQKLSSELSDKNLLKSLR